VKILIIEDEAVKADRIEHAIKESVITVHITRECSYNSALRRILKDSFDLLIVDMLLPAFSGRQAHGEEANLPYGGKELLLELARRRRPFKAVVLTQYEEFGAGADKKTFDQLDREMKVILGKSFLATLNYRIGNTAWRRELINIIEKLASSYA